MPARNVAPHGSWKSPITTDLLTKSSLGLSEIQVDSGIVYWLEGRPAEAGRYVVVRRKADGTVEDVFPADANARTRVHEYGGGSYLVADGVVWFTNFPDQRIFRTVPPEAPEPITPEPDIIGGDRYADARLTPDGSHLVCVREHHEKDVQAVNEIVAVPAEGGEPVVLATGHDFYSNPRPSPDGARLLFLAWDHPNMPWNETTLYCGRIVEGPGLADVEKVTGGDGESIFQPEWSAEGRIHYVSDRTGWWNLYAEGEDGPVPLHAEEAESGMPQWVFGLSTYCFLPDGSILLAVIRKGADAVLHLSPHGELLGEVPLPYTSIVSRTGIFAAGDGFAFVGATPTSSAEVVVADLSGTCEVLRKGMDVALDPAYLSEPEPIDFPTTGGETAHAFYYLPRNGDFTAPEGEKPPLLVVSHGGPTSAAGSSLNPAYQYFTSRGFAVVDVNYRGSTGYGRAYRDALNGRWGVVDTDDCIAAARFLADRGDVDGKRMAIRGGSAGGYTTLCALTFHDVFAAGASYYGVADAEALAKDTHKFESRYLDRLIGPYPEEQELYRERSPIHHTEGLSCPIILLQGEEDEVVPPAQAEAMALALREKGIPFALIRFLGEQHGFRRAESIKEALEAELYFYGRIFGFTPADPIDPILIENLS